MSKINSNPAKIGGGMCERLAPKNNMKNNESVYPSRGFGNSFTVPKSDYDYPVDALQQSGTSIFDPVLCEIIYKWFNIPNGSIIDPFAGGSVRGIVASILGYSYTGIELRKEQVDANIIQGNEICKDNFPLWINGDSRNIKSLVNDEFDLLFSCPPYGNLEVYSELESDLSTLDYDEFISAYSLIIKESCQLIKNNRFACFVVGDFRDKNGFYNGFVKDTIIAFENAGVRLYNHAILLNVCGSLPIRAGRVFQSGRKLGKTHQDVLIFYKGDPCKIKSLFGDVVIQNDFSDDEIID